MPSSSEGRHPSIQDVARHELIGLEVEVRSAHAEWANLQGRVVDETKHTFVVERASNGSETTVPKKGQTFVFRVGMARIAVQGDEIAFQPEDRPKKVKIKR